MSAPIVLGAGPAGSAAAALLARGGARPTLIDRSETVGDAICGGFLSWRTAQSLRELACDPATLGAHRVTRLRLYAGEHMAEAALPAPGFGLSRRALDTALRDRAVAAGTRLEIDRARSIAPGRIEGERQGWTSPAIFLATGKHDVRGHARPREAADPALGLRIRVLGSPALAALIDDAIELHMFPGGYAGIVLQEDGSANICLALRKSALADAGGDPWSLLERLAGDHPQFARRFAPATQDLPIDTIGAVPYGWIAQDTEDGLYRLGDQAAVIPSLAGEGMAIALASARDAARAFLAGENAESYQQRFARRAARPVRTAQALWHLGENPLAAGAMAMVAKRLPALARLAMRLSRI